MKKRIIILIIIGLLIIASGICYGIYKQYGQGEDPTFQIEIDKMIGGGFMGATNAILINSSGKVYSISSPDYTTPPKKNLIKIIDRKTLTSLRQSLVEANIFEMDEGFPQYSGKSWKITINGQTKKINFINTPQNLLETEKILNRIIK